MFDTSGIEIEPVISSFQLVGEEMQDGVGLRVKNVDATRDRDCG